MERLQFASGQRETKTDQERLLRSIYFYSVAEVQIALHHKPPQSITDAIYTDITALQHVFQGGNRIRSLER